MITPPTHIRKVKGTGRKVQVDLDTSPAEAVSQRDAYAQELVEMGRRFSRLVVLDADLSSVSKACLFREKYPARHVQVGVAEQNMVGIAAGMAQVGYIPLVHSLAAFVTGRAYDQIRMAVCYSGLNVKVVGLHAGVTLGPDGATHQTAEDLALMCALPGMCVLSPADAQQTRDLLPQLIEHESPAYLRLVFPKVPATIAPGTTQLGSIQVLRAGSNITLIATGQLVHQTIQAARKLGEYGISAEVLNVHTIKPLDEGTLIASLKRTGLGIVIEEHNVYGGLGSVVATVLAREFPCRLGFLSTNDAFGNTGTPDDLLASFGLQIDDIVQKAVAMMRNRSSGRKALHRIAG